MFYKPIRHTPLKNIKELFDFCYDTGYRSFKSETKNFFQKDSDIFICTEDNKIFVTPYRYEIPMILKEYGFSEKSFNSPCVYIPQTHSKQYFILQEMATREEQLKIYEENFEKSKKKNLEDIPFPENLDFNMREIFCSETVGCSPYYKINPLFSGNDENCNLCTFLQVLNDYALLHFRLLLVHNL